MNRELYRIVFNRARGLPMAVAEWASSHAGGDANHGLGGTGSRTGRASGPLRRVLLQSLIGLMCGSVIALPAAAAVVAYKPAPKNQQATILKAGNGVPLVNIQTPSAAGVSHNQYSQFDVDAQGVILNNARTNVQTQLGGWVQGNPWLAGGTARVILNEVISANPSQLLGYIEVAGSRAEVIVANPAGITCNGCGFINASQTTLTTGVPVLSNGHLDSYRVTGGSISIEGAGMDASSVDYTRLIARAVQVNAGLWANDLSISAGANQVAAATLGATPIASSGAAPAFAIDVAQLGGMYAGKITLVGTEAGVGVRNAGNLASTGALTLTVDGRLDNSGSFNSGGDTRVAVNGDLVNNSTFYAKGAASVASQGNLTNSGIIAARGDAQISAVGQLSGSAASLFAAGLNADGTLASSGNLGLSAGQNLAALGQNLAGADQTLGGSSLDLGGSETVGRHLSFNASSAGINATNALISASGTLAATTSQQLTTDGASISALQLNLAAHDFSNVGGELLQTGFGDMAILLAGDLDNSRGRIATNAANFTLTTTTLSNRDGSLEHAGAGNFKINAITFDGADGQLLANGHLDIAAGSVILDRGLTLADRITLDSVSLSSRAGEIRADSNILFTGSGLLDNSNGLISSASALNIADRLARPGRNFAGKTLAIANSGGTLIAGTSLSIDGYSLTGDGEVLSSGDLTTRLTADFINSGVWQADGNATFETSGTLINQASLLAGRALKVIAANLNNQVSGEIVGADTTLAIAGTLTNRGLINGGETLIGSDTLNNLGNGRIYGDHVAIATTTLNNLDETVDGVNKAAVIAARERLDIGATTIGNHNGALIFSAGDLAIGGGLDADHHATEQAATLLNSSATIEAMRDLQIDSENLTNRKTRFSVTLKQPRTDLPTGLELLAYDPILYFFWGIEETNPINWRNFVRDRFINHIAGISGVAMSAADRAALVDLVNAQPLSVWQDSTNVWNLLIGKIVVDHPEWIDRIAQPLSNQNFPLKSYDQHCRDDECDYVTYISTTRTDYQDVVTDDTPAGLIRAGGNG